MNNLLHFLTFILELINPLISYPINQTLLKTQKRIESLPLL